MSSVTKPITPKGQGKKRENLLWKLDLLEARVKGLSSTLKPRLAKTKRLLESEVRKKAKKQKKDTPEAEGEAQDDSEESNTKEVVEEEEENTLTTKLTRKELESKVNEVKLQLVEQKLHHGLVEANRGFKKAKQEESVKLVKRIKSARSDKEKSRKDKLPVLEEEFEELKKMDLQAISRTYIKKLLQKEFLKTKKQKEDPPYWLPSWIHDNEDSFYKNATQPQRNIFARLSSSASVKSVNEPLLLNIKYSAGLESKKKNKEEQALKESTEANLKNRAMFIKEQERLERESEMNEEESEDESELVQGRSHEEFDIDEDDFSQYDNMLAGTSDEESDAEESKPIDDVEDEEEEEDDDDDFFVKEPKVAVKEKTEKKEKEEKKEKKEKKERKEKKEPKMTLPALASGYFSGESDNEDDFNPDADNVVKEVTEKRKNRRGQRARQKIWEAKYGKNAVHVKKEGEKKYKEALQRQEEFEIREARREREKALHAIALEENPALKAVEEKKIKNATHPSWEAKKKLKEMQKTASFAGKKITFD